MPHVVEGVTLPEYNDPADVPASLMKMLSGVLPRMGGTLTGILNMSGAKITNVGSPTNPGDAVTKSYVDAFSSGAVPSGVFIPYAGSVIPSGWLLCNGQAVSRTSKAGLFAAIGIVYGSGDGSTTFNLPDMRGKMPMGVAASGTGSALGQTGGSIDHTHLGPSHTHTGPSHIHTMPTHNHLNAHTHPGASHTHPAASAGSGIGNTGTGGSHSHSFSDSFATGGPSSTNLVGAGGAESAASLSHTHSGSISGTTGTSSHSHNTPDHTHAIDTDAPTSLGTTGNASSAVALADPGDTDAAGTGATGASGTAATAGSNPPYLAANFIIKE